jgi:two-component system NtrC family sensor kinase
MEMMVTQSEKMVAVGQLAAGIAHEINNPLTVVLANAQILMRELPDQEDWRELAELINKAGERALHTVRNLLDFARREQLEFEDTNVNNTIERALEMLKHELMDRSVALSFHSGDGLESIKASPGNLQSVWVNLIMNALDSIQSDDGEIIVKTLQKGREIRVSIADNGKGIPPEGLSRIFEPFYTTKDLGRGTGLGLSICHRIVKQHGGNIEVDSQIGQGTRFTVSLPVD